MSETATTPQSSAPPRVRPVPDRPKRASVDIRSILFPSDLSPASDRAFDHARLLAESFGARMTLFHVVAGPAPHGNDQEDEIWRRAARSAHERLSRQASGLAVESDIVIGREEVVHRALSARIGRNEADLTVMATHGRGSLSQLVVGSVTETVVRDSRRPVLCVREPEHGVATPYRRILLPTDLWPVSRRAFPMAALLAGTFGAEVLALHVADVTAPRGLVGVSNAVEATPSEADVAQYLGPDFRGLRVRPLVLLGSAGERIVDTARSERVDLIVITTHGHDSLSDHIIGSHADHIIRRAPCPVLVV
jgi:nucleotide-binding universal stress UspA family protein